MPVTNCAPLLVDLFLYSYEADFIQELLRKNEKKLALSLNFTFPSKGDILSLQYNSVFGGYVERIYPIELKIKDTTDTVKTAAYLDLHVEIENEGRLRTKLYDKRDDFRIPIVHFYFYVATFRGQRLHMEYISLLEPH